MKAISVKIEKCTHSKAWYKNSIGSYFTVYDDRKDFIVKADYDSGYRSAWRHIDKQDCLILK
jgi:hypothetical protein